MFKHSYLNERLDYTRWVENSFIHADTNTHTHTQLNKVQRAYLNLPFISPGLFSRHRFSKPIGPRQYF